MRFCASFEAVLFGATLFLLTPSAGTAYAQAASEEASTEQPSSDESGLSANDQRARLHFESGRSHFEQGSYERALPEFEAAYELSHRPALLFNLGATLERLGQHEAAAEKFERFLSETPDYGGRDDLERRIENLRRRAAGQAEESSVPSGGSDDAMLFAGIGLLAGGAAAAVVAGVLGGMALAEEVAVRQGCFVSGTCTPSDVQGIDDLALGSDISWILAGALAAGGGALVIVSLLADGDSGESARLVPVISPSTGGVVVEGSF